MEQKKKEQDVLIVRDEQTGEIGVVAGLKRDGTPNMNPANAEHAQDFLRFDRHGDVLDNFFANFYRQCKEPKRFGFYRVAAEGADKVIEVLKELLKNPEQNKELLAPHKVDTTKYEQAAQQQAQEAEQHAAPDQTPQPEEDSQQAEQASEEQTPPNKVTSLSTSTVSTVRRSNDAGVSTLRRWSSRAIWSGCVITASRSLSSAIPISEASVFRCRRVCHCGRIPMARCRLCRTRSAGSRTFTSI